MPQHDRRTHLKLLGAAAFGFSLRATAAASQEVHWSSGTEKPRTKIPANATTPTITSMTIAFRLRRQQHCCRRTQASRITASSRSASGPRATSSFSLQPMGQTTVC